MLFFLGMAQYQFGVPSDFIRDTAAKLGPGKFIIYYLAQNKKNISDSHKVPIFTPRMSNVTVAIFRSKIVYLSRQSFVIIVCRISE